MIVDNLSREKTNDKHVHTFLLQPGPSILASALKEKTCAVVIFLLQFNIFFLGIASALNHSELPPYMSFVYSTIMGTSASFIHMR